MYKSKLIYSVFVLGAVASLSGYAADAAPAQAQAMAAPKPTAAAVSMNQAQPQRAMAVNQPVGPFGSGPASAANRPGTYSDGTYTYTGPQGSSVVRDPSNATATFYTPSGDSFATATRSDGVITAAGANGSSTRDMRTGQMTYTAPVGATYVLPNGTTYTTQGNTATGYRAPGPNNTTVWVGSQGGEMARNLGRGDGFAFSGPNQPVIFGSREQGSPTAYYVQPATGSYGGVNLLTGQPTTSYSGRMGGTITPNADGSFTYAGPNGRGFVGSMNDGTLTANGPYQGTYTRDFQTGVNTYTAPAAGQYTTQGGATYNVQGNTFTGYRAPASAQAYWGGQDAGVTRNMVTGRSTFVNPENMQVVQGVRTPGDATGYYRDTSGTFPNRETSNYAYNFQTGQLSPYVKSGDYAVGFAAPDVRTGYPFAVQQAPFLAPQQQQGFGQQQAFRDNNGRVYINGSTGTVAIEQQNPGVNSYYTIGADGQPVRNDFNWRDGWWAPAPVQAYGQ